jgi:hypothetical protein
MSAIGTVARWAAYTFFAGWYGLSVLQQMEKTKLARKVDPTSMAIPNWRFFAPLPARHDYNVLHRDRLRDGTVTEWREESLATPRSISQVLWHPRRRVEKTLFDVASELFQVSKEIDDPRRIQLTVSYLSLLNHIANRVPHADETESIQFLVAHSAAHEERVEPQLLFLSEWHALRAGTVDVAAAEPAPGTRGSDAGTENTEALL